ncbi:hypothetical protein GIB67_029919 [Kingdonia uniflora]|uniref:RNase H type-1 domain-containing protein n=1 Tax=Kingdonia uniflora TaxID=39325 RepID=A0A7J7MXI9_9MAGN|nr:hypothetical protein GIB67_029919 [Kingdonia uniflora]
MIKYYKSSSIWSGVKETLEIVKENSVWVIGDGTKVDIWRDVWLGNFSFQDLMHVDNFVWRHCMGKVHNIYNNGSCFIPENMQKPDNNGLFSVRSVFNMIRDHKPLPWWYKYVCNHALHPKGSLILWRMACGILPTDDVVSKKGMDGAGVVFRNHEGEVIGVLVHNLGIVTSFFAECFAIIDGLSKTKEKRWNRVWVVSDSNAAILAIQSNKIPWRLQPK